MAVESRVDNVFELFNGHVAARARERQYIMWCLLVSDGERERERESEVQSKNFIVGIIIVRHSMIQWRHQKVPQCKTKKLTILHRHNLCYFPSLQIVDNKMDQSPNSSS